MLKILIFVGIVLVVLNAMKYYVYRRFIVQSTLINTRLGVIFLLLLALGEIMLIMFRDSYLNHWQYFVVASCVVLTYTLFMACLVVDIIKMCICFFSQGTKSFTQAPPTIPITSSRRLFLKIVFDMVVVTLFVLLSVKSFSNALSIPPIKEVRLKVGNLRHKISIAMITDVHIGKTLGKSFLEKIVAKINTLEVDIVVIVGDLVDDKIHKIEDDLRPLKDLKSKEGVYYVAGNHEYYHGIDSILEYLASLNINIVHNINIELSSINIAGVSDLAAERFGHIVPDLEKAKEGLNPNKPSILLAHQPKFVRLSDVSDFDVVLCGHTHAGQVFPLSFFVWLDQHYVHGVYNLVKNNKRTQLYVSSGVGFWGPAIRFLAPSEIVHLVLE